MNIFFDVDHTILLSTDEGWHLRPGTSEVIETLGTMGHSVYLWTATGERHARRVVERYDLHNLILDCFDKDPVTVPFLPDMVVDDDEFLVGKYKGVHVNPYREVDPHDRELYRAIEYVQNAVP